MHKRQTFPMPHFWILDDFGICVLLHLLARALFCKFFHLKKTSVLHVFCVATKICRCPHVWMLAVCALSLWAFVGSGFVFVNFAAFEIPLLLHSFLLSPKICSRRPINSSEVLERSIKCSSEIPQSPPSDIPPRVLQKLFGNSSEAFRIYLRDSSRTS